MPKAASSKAKAPSARRSEPIQYIYIVTETESGPWRETEREVLGTYESKTQANKSAKTFARSRHEDYWDRDEDEPEYPEETQDANGCISIEAEDQEGDAWEITATRHVKTPANDPKPNAAKGGVAAATKKGKGATTAATKGKASASTPSTITSTASTAITHVYLVWRIEYRCGGPPETEIRRTYKSRDEANEYAKSMAREDFPDWFVREGEEEYDSDDLVFEEHGLDKSKVRKDADGCIFIAASDGGGDSFEIKVEKQVIYV